MKYLILLLLFLTSSCSTYVNTRYVEVTPLRPVYQPVYYPIYQPVYYPVYRPVYQPRPVHQPRPVYSQGPRGGRRR